MLKIVSSLSELHFGKLMCVYEESNRENAVERYGGLDRNLAILNTEQDFYQYLNEIFFSTKGAVYAIWEEEGRYVSALRLEPYMDGFLLEALETAPDCRRRGHSSALIRSVCSWIGDQGCSKIYSHVSKENVASLKVHVACGFRIVQDYAEYIDGTLRKNVYTLYFAHK